MSDPASSQRQIAARDAGLARLRTATRIVAVGTTALAGGLALLVGRTAAGRKPAAAHARARSGVARPARARRPVVPPPPALPPLGSTASAPPATPTPPAATAPAPTQQAPVVVSGGS